MKIRFQQKILNGKEFVMKNTLNKRLLRDLRDDFGKYMVIFLFIIVLISSVSGFIATDDSVLKTYEEGFEKYKIEDGYFESAVKLEDAAIKYLEDSSKDKISIYENFYKDEKTNVNNTTLRIYIDSKEIDMTCLMEGSLPKSSDEIAIDRLYAQNNDIEVGDIVIIAGKDYKISGFIALGNYSCLFENNTDMMFDANQFGVGVATKEGFEQITDNHIHYTYSWLYDKTPKSDREADEKSNKLFDVLKEKVMLTNYVPKYQNMAITFTGEDMGNDRSMFLVFGYIIIIIIAFVFAVTTTNTIEKEATVIGTLRAMGYTRKELICHYMVIPMVVTIMAAIAGNILGYTIIEKYFVDIYFTNYSLATYESSFSVSAFIDTTIIPVIMIFVINLVILANKLRLSPIKFMRRELKKKPRRRAILLNKNWPFMLRFRLRILIQNIGNYIVLVCGVFLAALIVIFGLMFGPLLADYPKEIKKGMICDYQYILKTPVETENSQAEKYCADSLSIHRDGFVEDEISIFGIIDNSEYFDGEFKEDEKSVIISNSFSEKYGYNIGDEIKLDEKYSDESYTFKVSGIYFYPAAISVFMPREHFNKTFGQEKDFFNGYFSNEKLDDIDEASVATIIDLKTLTKMSEQLDGSMGQFVTIFQVFGVVMFLLLMYVLSKQIIEKNTQSISMSKILGYTEGEIAKLYILATSIVVVFALLVAIPFCDVLLRWIFSSYIFTVMKGYIPYLMDNMVYVKMVIMGILSYVAVSSILFIKIKNIPKSDALKNVE